MLDLVRLRILNFLYMLEAHTPAFLDTLGHLTRNLEPFKVRAMQEPCATVVSERSPSPSVVPERA